VRAGHGTKGGGEDHHISAGNRRGEIGLVAIDDAEVAGQAQVVRVTATADDLTFGASRT